MLGISLLCALALAPQETLTVDDRISCVDCSLRLVKKLELGSDDGPGLLADYMGEAVARDDRGGYWFFSRSMSDQLWRFGPNGEPYVVSRPGSGPSEFRSIYSIGSAAGGGILGYDLGNARLFVLDATGTMQSSIRLSAPLSDFSNLVPVGPDSIVVGAVGRSGTQLGVPIHLVSMSSGSVIRQYGDPPETFQAQLTQQLQRRAVDYSRGTVAAAHYWEYRVDLFELASGRRLRTIVRTPRWYRPVDNLLAVNPPRRRPVPNTVGVRLLEDGTMLVLIKRPRPNWLEGFSNERTPEGTGRISSRSLVYETIVEFVDVQQGALLGQVVVPGVPLSFVPGRLEAAVVDDAGLTPRIHIYAIDAKR